MPLKFLKQNVLLSSLSAHAACTVDCNDSFPDKYNATVSDCELCRYKNTQR